MRRRVRQIIRWPFSGCGGMEHAYLVVSSLAIERISKTTGEIHFWAQEYDDGEHVPNAQSQQEIERIHASFAPYVLNKTFDSFIIPTASWHPYEWKFSLKNGVGFTQQAAALALLIVQLLDLRLLPHDLEQVTFSKTVEIQECPGGVFVPEDVWLTRQFRHAYEKARLEASTVLPTS